LNDTRDTAAELRIGCRAPDDRERSKQLLRSRDVLPDRFQQAGEAACLLEELGFVAVARKRDDEVSLELWRLVGGDRRMMKYVIAKPFDDAEQLARHCATQFEEM